jgi:hypothetical protein
MFYSCHSVLYFSSAPLGNDEIFFEKSRDNGTSFGNLINLSNNPGLSTAPQISSFGNNVYEVER